MKFGKNLAKVINLSDPEWAPFWLNYKGLKKMLKEIDHRAIVDSTAAMHAQNSPETLSQSAAEVAFFKFLRLELRKCNLFFASTESQLLARVERVLDGWRQMKDTSSNIVDGDHHKKLMAACVRLYKDVLLLENFAIMNYTAFSKILKKHDKVTGYCTRDRYMKNVVNMTANFTHYPRVIEMLGAIEELFRCLQMQSSSEVQLFIGAMRSINDQAILMMQQDEAKMNISKKCENLTSVSKRQYPSMLSNAGREVTQLDGLAQVVEAARAQENFSNLHACGSFIDAKRRCI